MERVAKLINGSGIADSKGENDTIRLWEGYREQATLWRALALGQLLSSPILLILCFYLYATRSTVLHVPAQPLPGMYAVNEVPDAHYIATATEMVNLIASYQPLTARRQFIAAAAMLEEPALTKFRDDMLEIELDVIDSTARTQVYFVDPERTKIKRRRDTVKVSLVGERMKFISGKPVPSVITKFSVTMKTSPRHKLNPYGIVITSIVPENLAE